MSSLLASWPLQVIKTCCRRSITKKFSQKPRISFFTKLKYILAATLGIGTGWFLYSNIPHSALNQKPRLYEVTGNKFEGSLREHFNFIDRVVKKCASSVVYIEIKDIKKIDPETGKPQITSNGSGFLVSPDGWILTNAHVVINKPQNLIMVMMTDGTTYMASVEDADMNMDLALLKIQAKREFPYLRLGKSSDVATGEWVIALGSPLSLSHSVTAGVVSMSY